MKSRQHSALNWHLPSLRAICPGALFLAPDPRPVLFPPHIQERRWASRSAKTLGTPLWTGQTLSPRGQPQCPCCCNFLLAWKPPKCKQQCQMNLLLVFLLESVQRRWGNTHICMHPRDKASKTLYPFRAPLGSSMERGHGVHAGEAWYLEEAACGHVGSRPHHSPQPHQGSGPWRRTTSSHSPRGLPQPPSLHL